MPPFPPHFLLMVVSVPFVMGMPEPLTEDGWEPPLDPPPSLPFPPMDGSGRIFHSDGNSSTLPPVGGMEAYCQMLMQGPVPIPESQLPWYCQCTRCQTTQGPKGDYGERGLPGKGKIKQLCNTRISVALEISFRSQKLFLSQSVIKYMKVNLTAELWK